MAEIGAIPTEDAFQTPPKRPNEDVGKTDDSLLPPAKRTRSIKGKGKGGKAIS